MSSGQEESPQLREECPDKREIEQDCSLERPNKDTPIQVENGEKEVQELNRSFFALRVLHPGKIASDHFLLSK